jgi:FkbM family methyltransferase
MLIPQSIRFITRHPLNRGRRLKALARFAGWQIRSRLVPGPVVFEWVRGARFLVSAGEQGLTGNLYTGLHEFREMAFLLHLLRADDLFVDVGANAGSYTILACAAVGARGYAFEPGPDAYRRLTGNVRLNRMEHRVTCLEMCLGAEPGTVLLTEDQDSGNHALAPGEQGARTVTATVSTLDGVLDGERPALVKIDVEGYEAAVLEGARRTLDEPTLLAAIIELNGSGERYGFDESQVVATMFGHGFTACSYDPFRRSLARLSGRDPASDNTLFVRDVPLVADRLSTAEKITVHGWQF